MLSLFVQFAGVRPPKPPAPPRTSHAPQHTTATTTKNDEAMYVNNVLLELDNLDKMVSFLSESKRAGKRIFSVDSGSSCGEPRARVCVVATFNVKINYSNDIHRAEERRHI
jgi:hypothetical protein